MKKYTKEFRYNIQLALPVMLGQLGHVMVGLVDNLMVGRLGAEELAAISLANGVFFVAFSIGIGISFAITPLIAEADGEINIEKGKNYFQHGTVLCVCTGMVLTLLLLFSKPLIMQLNQPEEVVILALPYLNIIAWSAIPIMIFQAVKQLTDGLSQTKYAMYAIFATNVLNVILNFVFIFGFWFIPRMELAGAGIGTLVSRVFMLVFLLYFVRKVPKIKLYLQNFNCKKWEAKVFRKMIHLGLPTAMQMFFEVALFSGAVFLSGMLGTTSQAANQIALNLSSMTFMIAVGLSITATIRAGNQKGKGNFSELRRVSFSIFLLTLIFQTLFSLFFIVFKDFLPTLYITHAEVTAIASSLLLISAIFQLSDGMQVVLLGALRGVQDVKIPSLICFIAYWIIGFPISYFLGRPSMMGATGIWIGLLTGLTASAIMLYIRFDFLTRKMAQQSLKPQ